MKVYQVINAIQKDLSETGVSKSRKNDQQGYKFRGIDEVYNALSPLLAKHGLCILPRMLSRDCVERKTKSGSALFYVTVEAEFDFVCAEDGTKHTVKTYGEAMDSADKATNKAMSAAYKYAAFQAFSIPTEGDNDADASHHEVAPRQNKQPATTLLPTDVAKNIASGVAKGDAAGAVEYLLSLPQSEMDEIWKKLDQGTCDKLTAAWPATEAA